VREFSSNLSIRVIYSPKLLCKLEGTWSKSLETIWERMG